MANHSVNFIPASASDGGFVNAAGGSNGPVPRGLVRSVKPGTPGSDRSVQPVVQGRDRAVNITQSSETSKGGGGNLSTIPIHQACKYVQSHGICQRVQALLPSGNMTSIMQTIAAFAASEGITTPFAVSLIKRCCNIDLSGGSDRYACYDNGTCHPDPNGQYSSLADCQRRCQPSSGDLPCTLINAGWCQKWTQAQGNPTAVQAEINNLATSLSISTTQANWLFTNCCPGVGDPCPPNPNSPFFTTDRFCESDYCVDGQGNPVANPHPDCVCCDDCPPSDQNSPFFTKPNFCNSDWCLDGQGNPSPNAHPDCRCCDDCPPTDQNSPFYTNPNEFCPQCGPNGGYAGHPDCKCCPTVSAHLPCNLILEGCADYQAYLDGTSPYTLPQILNQWVINLALPQMGSNTVTTQQVLDMFQRCCTPCQNFQDNGCCSKCDNANGDPTTNNVGGLPLMGPNHGCYSWCQQNQDCCPAANTSTATTRYRCDAGGCLACPPGTDPSICPHTEPNCNNSCGVPNNNIYSRASGPEPSPGGTLKQAGLGAGLFTLAVVGVGIVWFLSKVAKGGKEWS